MCYCNDTYIYLTLMRFLSHRSLVRWSCVYRTFKSFWPSDVSSVGRVRTTQPVTTPPTVTHRTGASASSVVRAMAATSTHRPILSHVSSFVQSSYQNPARKVAFLLLIKLNLSWYTEEEEEEAHHHLLFYSIISSYYATKVWPLLYATVWLCNLLSNTHALVSHAVHGIRRFLCQYHISKASMFLLLFHYCPWFTSVHQHLEYQPFNYLFLS